MKFSFSKSILLLPLLLTLSFASCSNKTGGSPGETTDLNSAVQGEVDSNLGSGLKESESSSSGICSNEGDAYERFAKLTHQSRDYVFQVAQSSTFHSLYQTRPSTYTKEDLALIQNYFVQADKKGYGSISVEIENSVIRFGAAAGRYGDDPTDQNWAQWERSFASLTQLLQFRETLYATYTTVFGLNGSIAWVPAFDGAIANLAPIKDFLAELNQAEFVSKLNLNAYRTATIRQGIATLSMSAAMRVRDRDYVLHTNFSIDKNTAVVTLRDVNDFDSAFEFRPASEATLTAIKAQITAVEAKLKDLEATLAATSTNAEANFSAEMAEHSRLQAEYNLLAALSYGEPRAIVEATFSAQTTRLPAEGETFEAAEDATMEYTPPTYETNFRSPDFSTTVSATYTANYNDNVRFIWNPQRNAATLTETAPSK